MATVEHEHVGIINRAKLRRTRIATSPTFEVNDAMMNHAAYSNNYRNGELVLLVASMGGLQEDHVRGGQRMVKQGKGLVQPEINLGEAEGMDDGNHTGRSVAHGAKANEARRSRLG